MMDGEGTIVYPALTGANLQGFRLTGLNFSKAFLRKAQLQGADLSRAQLQGANLTEAQLHTTDLYGAKLQGAILSSAQLKGADLAFAQLEGADLNFAEFDPDTNLKDANLRGAAVWFVDFTNVPQIVNHLEHLFGDSTVRLPEGVARPARFDMTYEDWEAFKTAWRAFQYSLGQDPENPE